MTDNSGTEKAVHPETGAAQQSSNPAAKRPTPADAAPKPGAAPRPGVPKPGAPKPAAAQRTEPAAKPAATHHVKPAPVPGPAHEHPHPVVVPTVTDPSEWGRVDDDGTAWVKTADGERVVGSWQAGDAAEGLAHFGRRFDDLATEVALLEARLAAGTDARKTKAAAVALADSLPTAAVIGDVDGLA